MSIGNYSWKAEHLTSVAAAQTAINGSGLPDYVIAFLNAEAAALGEPTGGATMTVSYQSQDGKKGASLVTF